MPVCKQCKKFSNCLTVDFCEHCGAKDWTTESLHDRTMREHGDRYAEKVRHGGEFSNREIFVRTVSVCIFLLLVGGILYGVLEAADESGWIPHTKDVLVSVDTRNWIPEEVKMCVSAKAKEKKELATVFCFDGDNDSSSQSRRLKVKFWGSIKADKGKLWKCTRGQEFLTCKLQ